MNFTNMEEFIKAAEKIGVGGRVSCTVNALGVRTYIKDGKLQSEDGRWYICQDIIGSTSCLDRLGYKYSFTITDHSLHLFRDFTPVQKTLYTLDVGDIIVGEEYQKKTYLKVLSVLPSDKKNPIYAISKSSDSLDGGRYGFSRVAGLYSVFELKEMKYSFYTPKKEEVVSELTIAQIEERLNITNLKIVD